MARVSSAQREGLRVALAKLTRDGFGRFVRIEELRACEGGDCGLHESAEWAGKYQQFDAALETIEGFLSSRDPEMIEVGREVFLDFRQTMRADAALIEADPSLLREDALRMRDAFDEAEPGADGGPEFIESREVDALDLTGLSGRDASRLALKLARWNRGAGKVYVWRNGRRYISPSVHVVNLTDPLLIELGLTDDLRATVKDRNVPVHYAA